MNLRTFSMVGSVAMLVLGGCIITSGPDSNGGSGGTGGTGDVSSSSVSVSSGGGTGGTGGGTGGSGGGMCAPNCAEAAGSATAPCAEPSLGLYNALKACTCDTSTTATPPGCKEKCTAAAGGTPDLCDGAAMPSADCSTCVQDAVMGCGVQFGECANDAG